VAQQVLVVHLTLIRCSQQATYCSSVIGSNGFNLRLTFGIVLLRCNRQEDDAKYVLQISVTEHFYIVNSCVMRIKTDALQSFFISTELNELE